MDVVRKKFAGLGLEGAYSLIQAARKGIGAKIFYSLADVTKIPEKNLAAILNVHPRTISNYRDKNKYFSPVESEHLLKLITLFTKGEHMFGDINQFNNWLSQPYWNTKDSALKLLSTPGGVDLISEEMDRLAHGYVA